MRTRRQNLNIKQESSVKLEDVEDVKQESFHFNGNVFTDYQEMVDAKRKRNQDMLVSTGLLDACSSIRNNVKVEATVTSNRGLKADRKRKPESNLLRRKSSRLSGVKTPMLSVEHESGGRFKINIGDELKVVEIGSSAYMTEETEPQYFNNRVNDGTELTIKNAVKFSNPKWLKNNSVESAQKFVNEVLQQTCNITPVLSKERCSPITVAMDIGKGNRKGKDTSKSGLSSQLDCLSADSETFVAKVVPERIFSVALHPSPHKIIAVAGDKRGHIGFWDTAADSTSSTDGVHLFKPHGGCVTHLEWNKSGTKMLSASYDGGLRIFDLHKEKFNEIFATYDDSEEFKAKPGYGLDQGYRYWVQYACMADKNEDSLYLSTSAGSVLHVDLRSKAKVTFNEVFSNKKINTVSLHPNGHTLATAGNERMLQLWDIRKVQSKFTKKSTPKCSPVSTQIATGSINSAFFSPSGKYLLSTNLGDKIDILSDAHLESGHIKKPTHSIRHDNHTGRWLSTFMARWHPSITNEELFVVGSMQHPRTMEIFDGNQGKLLRGIQGNAISNVVSRCCFHSSSEKLIVMGGTSSGRVVVAQ